MATLEPAHKQSIDNAADRADRVKEAVRRYRQGTIAQSSADMQEAKKELLDSVKERESAMLGLIQQETSKPIPSLLFDFLDRTFLVGTRRLERGIDPYELLSVNRASPKWVWNAQGKLSQVGEDKLAYEYDPMTGEALGHLNEPKSTNELLYCNMWDYNVQAVEFPGGADSFPGGKSGTSPVRVVTTSEDSSHYVRQRNIPHNEGQPASYYLHFKPQGCHAIQIRINGWSGSLAATFNASSETVTWTGPDTTYSRIVPLPDGWYRCELAGTVLEGSNGSFVHVFFYKGDDQRTYVGDSSIGADLYWGQLEVRTTPTSPIWTSGSSATREADNIRVVADGWQNRRQCSVFVEMSVEEGGRKNNNVLTLGAANGGIRMVLSREGQMYVASRYGNSFHGNSYGFDYHPSITRYAFSYEEFGPMNITIDNGANSRSIGAMDDKAFDVKRMTVGTQHTSATDVIRGYVRKVIYYPFMMDMEELEALYG